MSEEKEVVMPDDYSPKTGDRFFKAAGSYKNVWGYRNKFPNRTIVVEKIVDEQVLYGYNGSTRVWAKMEDFVRMAKNTVKNGASFFPAQH